MKIVVLAGGLSPERNVSLTSGAMVCSALRKRGHRAAVVDLFFGTRGRGVSSPEELYDAPIPEEYMTVRPAPDLARIRAQREGADQFGPGVLELCRASDVVFMALHGTCGEDGRIQAAFDLMGIPYTGSGYLPTAIALDKDLTKRLVADCPEVSTAPWETVDCSAEPIEDIAARTELPAVVKPLDSGSSIGVYIVRTRQELLDALAKSRAAGGRTVVERFISGREITVAVLDGRALPSVEIIPRENFYDYTNKYKPGATLEVCPAQIPPEWERRAAAAALAVFRKLGLAVYSRADFIITPDGTPWFLEINTLPGMTPTSLVPQEAAAVGMDYGELCETIIRASLKVRGRSE